jgi:catechol 2,3-dioxygenase-like lactoylglutathione lyase family enzyme
MNAVIRTQRILGRLAIAAAGVLVLAGMAGTLALLESTAAAQPAVGAPPAATSTTPISAVDSVSIVVSDLDRLTAFYADTLGFERVSHTESTGDVVEHLTGTFGVRRVTNRLRLGEESVELTQYLAPEGRPVPADSRSNDGWFQHIAIVVSDIDQAYAHLRTHRVRHASSGPQTLPDWNPNAGGISAFYFKDPDGHVLEIIHFPPGKGDPKWQQPSGSLFLGIDHTAIVVTDTDQSLAFYRDTLGLRIAGASENYGTEQEHLNNVFGARLRITALRAAHGPGVELLEYLAPSSGRRYPADSKASDLWSWTTTLLTQSAADLEQRLRATRTTWVSPGFLVGFDPATNVHAATQVRDPDGHVMLIAQPNTWPRQWSQEPQTMRATDRSLERITPTPIQSSGQSASSPAR